MARPGTTARRRRPPTTRTVYAAAGALLTLLAAALWVPVLLNPAPAPVAHPPWYALLILLAAFVFAELVPLTFEIRRQTLLVSLSEMPLVLGVLLLPPWAVGSVYLLSALAVFAVRRNDGPTLLMNTALVAVESGFAVATVAVMARHLPAGGLLDVAQSRFIAVIVGVLVGALVSAVVVAVAHRLTSRPNGFVRDVTHSMTTAAIVVGVSLAGFTVWTAIDSGPLLCLALIAAGLVFYRNYRSLLKQHSNLAGLYEFGDSVSRAADELPEWHEVVRRVRAQMHARVAALYLSDRPGAPTVLAAGPDGEIDLAMPAPDDPLLAAARRDGAVIVTRSRTGDGALLDALDRRGANEVMVAVLRSAGRDGGFLEVHDRESRWARFTDDDLTLFQALAVRMATSLDNHRLVRRLQHEAYHDPVTGLYNRSGLQARSAEMSRAAAHGGVLLVELDVLGEVTSALGHDVGEQLLVAVSARLVEAAGPDRPLGRLDADRFAVLFEPLSEDDALALARRMVQAARAPVVVEGMQVEADAIGGLALHDPGDAAAADPNVLLQQAQLALVSARSKQEQVAIYRPAIGELYHRRFQLVSQFRKAVESGRVSLHYQPKLTLAERELIGVEALVRWMHPQYGFVSPAELVEAIEQTSAVDVLFAYVLDTALAQVADWNVRGMHIPVAVNLSVRNLLAPDFARAVADALTRHDVSPDLLTLEVTESSVMQQPERSLPVLRDLHALGIRLSVDDFGTGYSSLAYLRRLPIDEIKIDRSFVQGMMTDLGDLAIVRAIIDLGHSLGLRVVAEGVEEESSRDALRSMRCDAMQGFLLARPLPVDRFENWLSSRTVPSEAPLGGEPAPLKLRT